MAEGALKTGTVLLLDVLKQQSALLFKDPVETVTCTSLEDVAGCLKKLEDAQRSGLHAAGYLAYELGFAFEPKLKKRFQNTGEPLLWFGLYEAPETLSVQEAKQLLGEGAVEPAKLSAPQFDMDREAYRTAFEAAQDHLAKGDIYQVNLTMRAAFGYAGDPEALFLDLIRRQPVEFAAYIQMEDRTILSLSPELFLERQGTVLRTKPMKGTAPRGRYASEDNRISRELARDPKQRSENTMIVDLMRNDLSTIAEPGTVTVPALCEVERYQSLHQMTTTVEGIVPRTAGFAAIIRNLFPCGSITGAPKLSAMMIADTLETGSRGVYTGSIGHLKPGGDFRLNVAIRTAVLGRDGRGVIGTGSGVVFDSGAAPEYDECVLKLRFLTDPVPEFDLIETMAYDPNEGYLLLDRHMQRLQASAAYFGFSFNADAIVSSLSAHGRTFHKPKRVRMLLGPDGDVSITATDLTPVDRSTVYNIVLASERTDPRDRFLYHKTTNRAFYDDTRIRYQAETGCQEVLFENTLGYLTEGSYMTLFLKRNGVLLTPALRHGVLPGTLRAGLLENGLAHEADLTREDLLSADQIYVGNSVRGLVRGRLLAAQQEAQPELAEAEDLQSKSRVG
ncbi:aminodeoxychorismate synthase component I [Roseibium denhamense]|uniref:aminodeoxychorismate synthase component I n=1 Tax=Roseibium denhamense TaxID=76305 RepID=UPI0024B7F3B1|nr:aminodeoxychorismate synthase component I [Roseibium denhamense]